MAIPKTTFYALPLNMNFKQSMYKHLLIRQLLWCTFALALLIFSLGISWQVNKTANFLYGFWYQTLQINTVISQNVPKNSQGKRDFPVNDFKLHEKMFTDIVQAIHQHGNGLADISYLNHRTISQKLLTKSEVQHLQDVANLLDSLVNFWWLNLFILLSILMLYRRKKKQLTMSAPLTEPNKAQIHSLAAIPTGKQKLVSLALFILLVVSVLGLWGFTQVFYYLHTVIFPEDHQWFFYYRDSLMATIMKAPDIFAAIAGQLILVALVLVAVVDALLSLYLHKTKLPS